MVTDTEIHGEIISTEIIIGEITVTEIITTITTEMPITDIEAASSSNSLSGSSYGGRTESDYNVQTYATEHRDLTLPAAEYNLQSKPGVLLQEGNKEIHGIPVHLESVTPSDKDVVTLNNREVAPAVGAVYHNANTTSSSVKPARENNNGYSGILLKPSYPSVAPRHHRALVPPFKWIYTGIFNVL